MTTKYYPPALPDFVNRLELTWEYTRSKIEGLLELYLLPADVCHGCFIIFVHSLFSYLLPDSVLISQEPFCELRKIYESTCIEYIKARRDPARLAQKLIHDFELALYGFTEKHFDCSNELVHKHIIQLCEYQKKVWQFCSCHDMRKMKMSPLPYHDD